MRRHSILFKINIVFAVAFVAVAVIAVAVTAFEMREREHRLFENLDRIIQVLPPERWEEETGKLAVLAGSHGFEIVTGSERDRVLAVAVPVTPSRPGGGDIPPPPSAERAMMGPPFELLKEGTERYLHFRGAPETLFRVVDVQEQTLPLLPLLLGGVLLLLSMVYYLIRKSLRPLRELRRQIRAFGEGGEVEAPQGERRDEISTLYREFFASTRKVHALTETRKLFLRNVLHELNTPVAKGKIIAAMIEDRNRGILENIFERLELLVRELASIEKVTSGEYALRLQTYRVVDIVDHAEDLLFLDDGIFCRAQNETLECDFELMSLVFKNLIDNALKYGEAPSVTVSGATVRFASTGVPLEHSLAYYTEPFVRGAGYEGAGRGFGLGLYIVTELLRRQGYALEYRYENGTNLFIIAKQPAEGDGA